MAIVTSAFFNETAHRWLHAEGMPIVCDLNKSKGVYLHDIQSGRDFLDFYNFLSSRLLSYGHPKLSDSAFVENLGQIAINKPLSFDINIQEYSRFIEIFSKVVLGGEFSHVFFVNNDSVAVDSALKAAFAWKQQKNLEANKPAKGSQILSFKEAFHGKTGYALWLSDNDELHQCATFPRLSWPQVINPKIHFSLNSETSSATVAFEQVALAAIKKSFVENPDDIAAIIIEPIQGEGGDNYFRKEFFLALRHFCDENECLLIFDEQQTGFAITGKWWAWQHYKVKPDLLIFSKKTQVSGFAATARLDNIVASMKSSACFSNMFMGNSIDVVRCERLIKIIQEEHLLDNAINIGKYLHKLLSNLATESTRLSNVRSCGLLAAFDLKTKGERDQLLKACFKEELLLIPCQERSVRMRCALDIKADAIGRAVAQLEAALYRAFTLSS
ncbi:MAG: L-lysine 6-transaminase [Deltaproteobacteria bacterium]|nr:L-lysine 6-transaminase [Deltaproteobacteria bacterium]